MLSNDVSDIVNEEKEEEENTSEQKKSWQEKLVVVQYFVDRKWTTAVHNLGIVIVIVIVAVFTAEYNTRNKI